MFEMIGIYISVPLYTIGALLLGASITAGLFVFHVAVVPLVFKFSKTFRRSLIFANFVQWPLNVDLEDPSASGIEGTRNLTIQFQSKVDNCHIKLGLWHILPKSVHERLKGHFNDNTNKEELNRLLDEELSQSKTPVVLYCHGNSNNRATSHRILLYKLFQQMDFHTIAFDYRGYGDSTNVYPSEEGVVEDSLVVYEWLVKTTRGQCLTGKDAPSIFVWGHSLGTGISSALLGNLKDLSIDILDLPAPLPLPKGLILEAPFSNLADEVAHHPLSKLVTWLPYYEAMFVRPFRCPKEARFCSDKHLCKVKSLPILILHAKDDVIVPFIVGLKLYRTVIKSRSEGGATCKLHAYDKKDNLGHKYICNAQDLPQIVGDFISNHQ